MRRKICFNARNRRLFPVYYTRLHSKDTSCTDENSVVSFHGLRYNAAEVSGCDAFVSGDRQVG
jgi:hypothetical protein